MAGISPLLLVAFRPQIFNLMANDTPVPPSSTAAPPAAPVDIDALAAAITKQGSVVKQLKKDGANADVLEPEIAKLLALRQHFDEAKKATGAASDEKPFNRDSFDDLMKRKMFVVSAFEIHGGVAGLFDYGPSSCALKANVLDVWRKHFVLEENMLEMECTCLTPEVVLKTSGHVDKFTDLMVKDVSTGECFRADKLLEDFIDKFLEDNPLMPSEEANNHRRIQRQADAFSPAELHKIFQDYKIKSPTTGNDLTEPFAFNLMFKTSIGPEGVAVGFLRPETAQGLFVNFRRLLDYNGGRMPFAAAQIGLGFRNEIAPRNGLLRVREFCMAEIEHFVNPNDKAHPRFKLVADKELVLFPQEEQLGSGKTVRMTVGQAVAGGTINNETLGYFMAKTWIFMEKIGMDPERLRFRQHLKTEMAHYAADCWDLEIKSSYGWVECVGHADRACYDLQVHSKKSGTQLIASQMLPAPKQVTVTTLLAEKAKIGKTFKQDQKKVLTALEEVTENPEALAAFQATLESQGKAELEGGFVIEKSMVSWKSETKTIIEEKFMPSVIEPSFGIGRVLYSLMEHAFYQRKSDEQKVVMRFKPLVAPIKVGVYPLQGKDEFTPYVKRVTSMLTAAGLSNRADTSGVSVGRRYARSDEIGTPFGVTIDFETLLDESVTVRDRDTTAQIRVPIKDLTCLITRLVHETTTWEEVTKKYPIVRTGDEDEEEGDATASAKTPSGPVTLEKTTRGKFSRPSVPLS